MRLTSPSSSDSSSTDVERYSLLPTQDSESPEQALKYYEDFSASELNLLTSNETELLNI